MPTLMSRKQCGVCMAIRFLFLFFPLSAFAAIDYGSFASPVLSALPSLGSVLIGICSAIAGLFLLLHAKARVLDFIMSYQGYERYKPSKPVNRRIGNSYYRLRSSSSSAPSSSKPSGGNVSGLENYRGGSR